MFDYLTGRLVEKHPTYVVLENNGLAFKLFIPLSTYDKLPPVGPASPLPTSPKAGEESRRDGVGGEVKIYTYLHLQSSMQESAVRLYGFISLEERRLFQLLCTVQRVGPTVALRILSGASVRDFRQAVISENMRYLARIRGVGPKTAQRIIIELKEALSTWRLPSEADKERKTVADDFITDAVLALVALGYPRLTADKTVKDALKTMPPQFTAEELVKKALQEE